MVAHRRVADGIPLELETRVELRVAGRSREVLLGPALPEHFVPMSLDAALPARLEADGRLRVQVRPGTWRLRLLARRDAGPVDSLALPERSADREEPWDADEVWVFDARNDLRLVHVEGASGIDPQQTALPDDWKHLPAYLMSPGDTLRLVEKRRGNQDPAPDQLALERTWWLDFDGAGYTVHDELTGTLQRSWRLEASLPTILGRVAIGGQNRADDLDFVEETIRKEGPQRSVDQAAGNDFLLGGAAFTLEKTSRNAAAGVGVLAVVDGQRQEGPGNAALGTTGGG